MIMQRKLDKSYFPVLAKEPATGKTFVINKPENLPKEYIILKTCYKSKEVDWGKDQGKEIVS